MLSPFRDFLSDDVGDSTAPSSLCFEMGRSHMLQSSADPSARCVETETSLLGRDKVVERESAVSPELSFLFRRQEQGLGVTCGSCGLPSGTGFGQMA